MISSDGCSNQTIASGANCTVDVRFGPSALGARSANLTVPSNDPSSPLQVGLAGTGGPLPSGATGATGATGNGTTGPVGPTGHTGPTGTSGLVFVLGLGPTGPKGPAGGRGKTGKSGKRGKTGKRGRSAGKVNCTVSGTVVTCRVTYASSSTKTTRLSASLSRAGHVVSHVRATVRRGHATIRLNARGLRKGTYRLTLRSASGSIGPFVVRVT